METSSNEIEIIKKEDKKEEKKKTIIQSKEWSLSIEAWNKEREIIDLKIEEVIEKIKHEAHYYFGINHDKDVTKKGEIRSSHLHIVIKLKAKITLNGILKKLENILEIDKTRINAQVTRSQDLIIRYLMHIDNPEKHQYPRFAVITNRPDILNNAIKGENEREDLTAENLIITIERLGGNRLKIMAEIGLKNYTRYRGTISDIMEEMEIGKRYEQSIEMARGTIVNANEIASMTLKRANKELEKRITELEQKVINTKAVELLNKSKNRR